MGLLSVTSSILVILVKDRLNNVSTNRYIYDVIPPLSLRQAYPNYDECLLTI
jgi:hypothetical protein